MYSLKEKGTAFCGDLSVPVPNLSKLDIGWQPEYATFSMTTALTLAGIAPDSELVLDLGSGAGTQGIVALHLGVPSVIFVENDLWSMEVCKENLSGHKLGKHITFLAQDITEFSNTAQKLSPHLEGKHNWCLVLNLGYWPNDYDEISNDLAIKIVQNLESKPSTVVLGGYNRGILTDRLISAEVCSFRELGYEISPQRAFLFHPKSCTPFADTLHFKLNQ